MTSYIWDLPNWPSFHWDEKRLLTLLSSVRLKQGQLIQKIQGLLEPDLKHAEARIFEEETIKTAQIEGERYSPESVRSSIHRRLGMEYAGLPRTERHIDGLVEVLFDATLNSHEPLTVKRLLSWQAALFPTGYSGLLKINVGKFRTDTTGPMQVVSGAIGREKVHYQAPPAIRLKKDIETFLSWWKNSEKSIDGIIRAGIAHLYFVTLHPFDDGNGRITRALTDMAMAQDDKLAKRYYSLSREISKEKKAYYQILEQSQKGNLNVTTWLIWFLDCFSQALDESDNLLKNIFIKTIFWHKFQAIELNARQRKIINKMLDIGQGNFIGGLTTRKYLAITKTSRATAIREINDLLDKKFIVRQVGEGRSVNYDLNWLIAK